MCLPGGDGVSVLLVYAGDPHHTDGLDVILVDAQVGALDGDRDAPLHGSVARDDLRGGLGNRFKMAGLAVTMQYPATFG